MSDDGTVLEHLLEGRTALVRELERLTAALSDLDAVIGQIRGAGEPESGGNGAGRVSASRPRSLLQDVNPGGKTSGAPSRSVTTRPVPTGASAGRGRAPKSIRVHVLEMLGAEDREFGLAEIIDRIHAAGIQAHDDAVRSITVKLMKDGRVERVGRGQYRLAHREAVRSAQPVATPGSTDESPTDARGQDESQVPPSSAATPSYPSAKTYPPPLNLAEPWDERD